MRSAWRYVAVDAYGRKVKGYVAAETQDEAIRLAEARGHYPTKIRKIPSWILRLRGFSEKDLAFLFDSLAKFVASGVDIQAALDLVAQDAPSAKFVLAVQAIRDGVAEGLPFHQAAKRTGIFGPEVSALLAAGEESGRIVDVFEDLKRFYEEKARLKRNVYSALIYPCLVLVMALGAVIFVLPRLVAPLERLFRQMSKLSGKTFELPWPTKVVFGLYEFSKAYGALVFVLAVGAVALVYWSYRTKPEFRRWVDRLLLRIPVAGTFIRRLFLYRFLLVFRLLFEAGTPVAEIIRLERELAVLVPLREDLDRVEEALKRGASLTTALERAEFIPDPMKAILRIGERTGRMAENLKSLTHVAKESLDFYTRFITQNITPFITIIAGLLVGGVVFASYLPLFQLMDIMKSLH